MFEPPPRPTRRWFGPSIAVVGAGIIGAAIVSGGPWLILILLVAFLWAGLGIRFMMSDRGKSILFSRYDDRSYGPRGRN